MRAFPWGEVNGPLAKSKGPRTWQRERLIEIGDYLKGGGTADGALQIAVASGHGIGKSALVAWVIYWAMSTFEDTRGIVTANTDSQLRTKTWPELTKWHGMAINRHWFKIEATSLFSRMPGHEKNWRIDAVPWSETNTDAFAGLHNVGKRILVVFDEAAGIPPSIWEVTEGALTDEGTQIIWLAFGNPTRNTGRFFDAFTRLKHRWKTVQIDSRTVEGTNKAQLQAWVDDYGEDSDFVRSRVRGIFPRASAEQFIRRDIVDGAMRRTGNAVPNYAKRIAAVGVDVARFGSAQSVIATRIGRDARSFPAKRYRGLDTVQLASRVGEHVTFLRSLGLQVIIFVDGGGVGGGVVDNLVRLNYDPIEIQFGSSPTDERKWANKRTEMWASLRTWLSIGEIENNEELATELTGLEYFFNKRDLVALESKDDAEGPSPDWGDALALTHAQPVPEFVEVLDAPGRSHNTSNRVYDPLERMGRS
jgi:hypothetical protein